MLPVGIVAARSIRSVLGVNAGQVLPVFPIIVLSFLVLAPICVILGFLFSLACHIYRPQPRPIAPAHSPGQEAPAIGIGSVYILEAIGSMIGGAVTSMVLIKFFGAVNITAFFTVLNISAALFLQRSRLWKIVTSILLFAVILAWPLGLLSRLEEYSLKRQWQGYELVASKNSIYGNIAVTRRQEDFSLFENGLRLYTIPDKINAEESAHFALLEHPNPQNILLIGHGAGELTEELLKEPVKKIDYVELDPLIITMTKSYLPDSYYRALKDSRVSIKNLDGRFFAKTTKDRYDCVIVRVGDPYTAQMNRYYTVEFFNEAKNILKEGGILSLALSSSENYMSSALSELLSSVYFSLKDVFSACLVIPGDTAYFVASDKDGYMTYDHKILEERVRERSLNIKYVREYYLFSKLSPEKITRMNKIIEDKKGVRINHDFRPSAYYYGLIFWTTLSRDPAFSAFLRSINERIIWQAIGIFIILLSFVSVFLRRSFKRAALIAVAAGGFSTMAFQILLLLAFQIMYGYLFYKLGIILTAFMAGLALGAVFGIRAIEKLGKERYFLIAVQGDFLLYSLILPAFFLKGGSDLLFPVMSAIAGFIGGSQFPIAVKILSSKNKDAGGAGGLAYGVDLFGSFLGAVLTGVLLVPVLGIPKTCIALAVINTAILALLVLNLHIEE